MDPAGKLARAIGRRDVWWMLEVAMSDLTRSLRSRDVGPTLFVGWLAAPDADDQALGASWESDGCVEAPYEMSPSEVIMLALHEMP